MIIGGFRKQLSYEFKLMSEIGVPYDEYFRELDVQQVHCQLFASGAFDSTHEFTVLKSKYSCNNT